MPPSNVPLCYISFFLQRRSHPFLYSKRARVKHMHWIAQSPPPFVSDGTAARFMYIAPTFPSSPTCSSTQLTRYLLPRCRIRHGDQLTPCTVTAGHGLELTIEFDASGAWGVAPGQVKYFLMALKPFFFKLELCCILLLVLFQEAAAHVRRTGVGGI